MDEPKKMTDIIGINRELSQRSEIPAIGNDGEVPYSEGRKSLYKIRRYPAEALAPMIYGNYCYLLQDRSSVLEDPAALRKQCDRISKWMTRTDCKRSIVLSGEMGVGKTTMLKAMKAVYRTINCRIAYIEAEKLPGLYVDYQDTYQMLMNKAVEFLFIDDVGIENQSFKNYGTDVAPFTEIVNARYNAGLPMIISSNLRITDTANDFAEVYGARVADRIKEMMNTLTISGKSHRK